MNDMETFSMSLSMFGYQIAEVILALLKKIDQCYDHEADLIELETV